MKIEINEDGTVISVSTTLLVKVEYPVKRGI